MRLERRLPRPIWVKSAVLTVGQSLPIFLDQRTFSGEVGTSQRCQNRNPINAFDHPHSPSALKSMSRARMIEWTKPTTTPSVELSEDNFGHSPSTQKASS
jgi:hypothetical protein